MIKSLMQKNLFYSGRTSSRQNNNQIKIVDINILLNKIKIDEKNKKKDNLKLVGISLLIIFSVLFFIV
tara:strand:+ start:267 stop:470 length:204 start_codon:yes stop_codon:yes gene_type:complete